MRLFSILSLLLMSVYGSSIKIGVVLPLNGEISSYGISAKKGIETIHELFPKVNGKDIEIIYKDNKSDKIETAIVSSKLIAKHKVKTIIGPVVSENAIALANLIEQKKLPLISPVATSIELTKNKKYTTRATFDDSFQGKVAAKFAYENLNKKSVVIVCDQKQNYSKNISKIFEKEFIKLGGVVLKTFKVSSGERVFDKLIDKIEKIKPELIYFPLYSKESAYFLNTLKIKKIDTTLLSSDGMIADEHFFELLGNFDKEIYYTSLFSLKHMKKTPLSTKFFRQYHKNYKKTIHPFGVIFADAYLLVYDALKKCKDNLTSACINNAIKHTSHLQVISGQIDVQNSYTIRNIVINKIKNKKESLITTIVP